MTSQLDRLTGLVGPAAFKVPCQAVAVTAITLSGEQTVNGVALTTGERVLVTAQASSVDNGIYVVDTGDWNRAADCDGPYDLVQGSLVYVYSGTTDGNKIWKCTSADDVDIGTDNLTWAVVGIEVSGNPQILWCGTATGTANALVLTPASAADALDAGLIVIFKSGAAGNSGATTLAVSGLTATAVQSNGSACVGGEIEASKWYTALYDGAAFQLQRVAPAVLLDMFTAKGMLPVGTADGAVAGLAAGTDGYPLMALAAAASGLAYRPPGIGSTIRGGYIEWTVVGNALTAAVKTWAGNDPSTTDPVFYSVRDVTATVGLPVDRKLTAALSVTVPNTATMGVANAESFRLWAVIFNDGGTDRLGVIRCVTTAAGVVGRDVTNIYPLAGWGIASSTTVGTGSDSAGVFYTDAGVTSKAYATVGYATWETGLTAAGVWDAAPTREQLFGAGVSLPGGEVQTRRTDTGAVATGSTVVTFNDTAPTSSYGDQFMTQAITPSSAANPLRIKAKGTFSPSTNAGFQFLGVYQDSGACIKSNVNYVVGANQRAVVQVDADIIGGTTAETTIKVRAGNSSVNTMTFNGEGGNRTFGGTLNSFVEVKEIMG